MATGQTFIAGLSAEIQDRYLVAIEATLRTFPDVSPDVLNQLCDQLISECEAARKWGQSQRLGRADINQKCQEDDKRFNEQAKKHARHVGSVADFLQQHPDQADRVLIRWRLNEQVSSKARGVGREILPTLLTSLATALKEGVSGMPLYATHHTQLGNLGFDRRVSEGRVGEMPLNGLLFSICLLFRWLTHTGHFHRLEPGIAPPFGRVLDSGKVVDWGAEEDECGVPTIWLGNPPEKKKLRGRPHYDLACDFVQAALGGELDKSKAANRLGELLRRNPNANWQPWGGRL